MSQVRTSGCFCGAVQLRADGRAECSGSTAIAARAAGWLGAPIHGATLWPTPSVTVVKGADKLVTFWRSGRANLLVEGGTSFRPSLLHSQRHRGTPYRREAGFSLTATPTRGCERAPPVGPCLNNSVRTPVGEPMLPRSDYYEARMYLRRDAPGDRERAATLLAYRARAVSGRSGMTGWAERAEQMLATATSSEAPIDTSAASGADTPAARSPLHSPLAGAIARLQREGDYWTVAYGDVTSRLHGHEGAHLSLVPVA